MENRSYEAPTVLSFGSIQSLTAQGGGNSTDVPEGTPSDGDINNITS